MLNAKGVKGRRGQAEIIGGLFVLTLIFLLALPILLNMYNQTLTAVESVARINIIDNIMRNERVVVEPLDLNNPDYLALGWVPGVFLVNSGPVEVDLVRAYIINTSNNEIDYIIDLTTLRPETLKPGHIVKAAALNPTIENPDGEPLPPAGEPIRLSPGDRLLLAFNLANPEVYMIVVQSATGVLHPIGAGTENTIASPSEEAAAGDGEGVFKGIFAPQSGFRLSDGNEIAAEGQLTVWRPSMEVELLSGYRATFIYDDNEYPGMYKVYVKLPSWEDTLVKTDHGDCWVDGGWEIYISGFVGTYYLGKTPLGLYYVYVKGFAFKVEVYDDKGNERCVIDIPQVYYSTAKTSDILDFDGNGVQELVVYTALNTPVTGFVTSENPDADGRNWIHNDAIIWEYVVLRDISGADFIQVTGKINYYWTGISTRGWCPGGFRTLKIFSVVVWEYDDVLGKWVIHNWKDYFYTLDKPRQIQFNALFPVMRDGIYRVGIIFYDNYTEFASYDGRRTLKDCNIEFTYGLEYLMVEYGVVNPLFEETPPVYIIAIPDPARISGIGEEDFAAARGITDISEARLAAQQELLRIFREELARVGIGAPVIIDSDTDLCNVLFPDMVSQNLMEPPKNAIIIWLQGDVDISNFGDPAIGCSLNYDALKSHVTTYNWVWVQATGTPFWDLSTRPELYFYTLNYGDIAVVPGSIAQITDSGVTARYLYAAISLLNELPFQSFIKLSAAAESIVVVNASFYYSTDESAFGHVALMVENPDVPGAMGVYVLMHTHIDWDTTGDGVDPLTLVQMAVAAGLEAYKVIAPGG